MLEVSHPGHGDNKIRIGKSKLALDKRTHRACKPLKGIWISLYALAVEERSPCKHSTPHPHPHWNWKSIFG
jgi:hypothetical protein